MHVIYTGAVPNQHVIPLTRYLVDGGRKRAFCVGSNYIWAWENNRILRDELSRMAARCSPSGMSRWGRRISPG